MLNKTIKLGIVFIASVLFISGCASTSETTAPVEDTAPPVVSAPTTTESVQSSIVELGTIFYFDYDQSTLTGEAQALLRAHAAALQANPRSIRLEGHADERGSREYNMALGEKRANAVRDFLYSQGLNSPIEVVSYGEERPADTSSSEFAWSLNRRVELK